MEIFNAVPKLYTNDEMFQTVRCYENIKKLGGVAKYIGVVHMNHPQHGVQEFTFKIPAVTIEDAFEQFDEAMETEAKRLQGEQQTDSDKIIQFKGNNDLIT
jgi:hypothetical protein